MSIIYVRLCETRFELIEVDVGIFSLAQAFRDRPALLEV